MSKVDGTKVGLRDLLRLRELLRGVMLEGKILLMASEEANDELIRLVGLEGIVS